MKLKKLSLCGLIILSGFPLQAVWYNYVWYPQTRTQQLATVAGITAVYLALAYNYPLWPFEREELAQIRASVLKNRILGYRAQLSNDNTLKVNRRNIKTSIVKDLQKLLNNYNLSKQNKNLLEKLFSNAQEASKDDSTPKQIEAFKDLITNTSNSISIK